jgi:hypothetical protein
LKCRTPVGIKNFDEVIDETLNLALLLLAYRNTLNNRFIQGKIERQKKSNGSVL